LPLPAVGASLFFLAVPFSKTDTVASRRLMKEVKDFCKEKADGVSAFPDAAKGILSWKAKIVGAASTPYAGQTYELQLDFPEDYPMRPPTVVFVTPCFHPNVHESRGDICLDILQDKWSCVYNVRTVLISILSLLADPNTASPLNPQAAAMWDQDQAAFKAQVDAAYAKRG
jgi:ubiquitin-conjugating enzyme E2 C